VASVLTAHETIITPRRATTCHSKGSIWCTVHRNAAPWIWAAWHCSRRGDPQAAEGIDERAYWAAVLPGAVADHDAQVPLPLSPFGRKQSA